MVSITVTAGLSERLPRLIKSKKRNMGYGYLAHPSPHLKAEKSFDDIPLGKRVLASLPPPKVEESKQLQP